MASVEAKLISNVLRDRNIKPLLESGLGEDDFQSMEGKEWYRHLNRLYHSKKTYGEVPSVQKFKRRFPAFDYCPDSDSSSALCQELLENNLVTDGQQMAESLLEALEDQEVDAALGLVNTFLQTWNRRQAEGGDLALSEGAGVLREQYTRTKTAQGMLGLPWPWESVNDETLGMQPGQLIIVYGRPKSMKTWVALYVAVHAYLYHNARVLFYSREMDKMQLLRRAASIVAGLDYGAVKKAKLSSSQEEDLFDSLDMLQEKEKAQEGQRSKFIISNDRGPNLGATTDLLVQKAKDEQVDLLVVDALYKLADRRTKGRDSDWKTQANIVQDLKDAAVDLGIPVIAVTQANRSAGKKAKEASTGGVAFTDSVGQEADILCRIIKGRDETTGKSELILCWPATRDEELKPMLIHAEPGGNFTVKRLHVSTEEIDDRDKAETNLEDDAKDASKTNATKGTKSRSTGRRKAGGKSALAAARTRR
jgi:KaiC/GvpD/RAD55 family RecA-like ATPase